MVEMNMWKNNVIVRENVVVFDSLSIWKSKSVRYIRKFINKIKYGLADVARCRPLSQVCVRLCMCIFVSEFEWSKHFIGGIFTSSVRTHRVRQSPFFPHGNVFAHTHRHISVRHTHTSLLRYSMPRINATANRVRNGVQEKNKKQSTSGK